MTTTTTMACGNCGNGLFRISRSDTEIHATCTSCSSTSVITTKPAELHIDWGEGAHGILCEMAPSMEQVTPPEPPATDPPAPICQPDKCNFQYDAKGGSTCTTCGDWLPF